MATEQEHNVRKYTSDLGLQLQSSCTVNADARCKMQARDEGHDYSPELQLPSFMLHVDIICT